ncbi:MAG TPA: SDR family oxidoreductase [Thermoleophilaceae bacterium]|nr:SDR family oxidoreductase [Thermoleophilaceae bacterium]
MTSLAGQKILITGAARGIGAESARRLAARGAQLALVGLEPEELERVATQCGGGSFAIEADVTDRKGLEQAVEEAVERLGGIDCVVANAGVASAGFVRNIDPDAFERVIEVNLLGVWRTVRAALPHVLRSRGYVLVIASSAAALHGPGMAPYAASKAGAEAFANSLRSELRHHGVDVGVGYLLWIGTDMVAGVDAHPAMAGFRAKLPGPFKTTHPVSKAGDAVVDGIENRRRWVTVPQWLRGLLVLRGAIGPLLEAGSRKETQELDELMERNVTERGAEEASALVGAGGAADRSR